MMKRTINVLAMFVGLAAGTCAGAAGAGSYPTQKEAAKITHSILHDAARAAKRGDLFSARTLALMAVEYIDSLPKAPGCESYDDESDCLLAEK